jgi:protocatechuate 3,4-dioxygenase beta subunit
MERKNFLRAFVVAAAAGPTLLNACKKDDTTTTSSSTSSTSTTSSSTSTASTTSTSTCVTTPTEEEGPFPYPGGESTDPLDRSDVTGGQSGVSLQLNFVVVNTNDSCNTVENVRVDIWSCNANGYYSGYDDQAGGLSTVSNSYGGETWLRGYQLSDSAGAIQFTTIYPGWYSGRATHLHIEVYISGVLKKTSQVAFPETISDLVQVSTYYSAHGVNPISNTADRVFGDSTTDLAIETLSLTGSVSAGYVATHTIGLAL